MRKKGMIFPVLISAILALVVLIIVIAVLGGKVSWFNQNTNTCDSKGGECSSKGECEGPVIYTGDCEYYDNEGNTVDGRLGQCCLK